MDKDFGNRTSSFPKKALSRMTREGQKRFNEIVESFNPKWITLGIDSDTINFLQEAGDYMAPMKKEDKQALTNSQIRNVYGELKRIQMKGFEKSQSEFLLLRPKVAYAAKRKSDKDVETGMDLFKNIFDKAYVAVVGVSEKNQKEKAFKNFCSIMEGLIAYHKYYGGK